MNQNLPVEARELLEEAAALLDGENFRQWKSTAFCIRQYLATSPAPVEDYVNAGAAEDLAREMERHAPGQAGFDRLR